MPSGPDLEKLVTGTQKTARQFFINHESMHIVVFKFRLTSLLSLQVS
ncbi:hypothetical protein AB205_0129560 [Aquarana catesbeiana]|uniref:Uncharacterized protein n=1 Tax=Aquarana catesbeiana TaxID=8400 RepID=A0A2G9S585_AQUCT|nr:hypothetical protein AB205_0129560 [Aquarana catesbeiana]